MGVTGIVLAAGQGTRMKSNLPKVLHQVGGKSMVQWVLDGLYGAEIKENIVVLGHQGEQVEAAIQGQAAVVYQNEQLGTGHAVMQAAHLLKNQPGCVLVLCGDTPLLTSNTLSQLVQQHQQQANAVTLLTAIAEEPFGYGRIVRNQQGDIEAIVEQKDATIEQQEIDEINAGTYCFDQQFLLDSLVQLDTNNAQGEYYLTDLIAIAGRKNKSIGAVVLDQFHESLGVNNRVQLAQAEKILNRRNVHRLLLQGVTFIDPEHSYIGAEVMVGSDTIIEPGVILEGQVTIGSGCVIGANSRIRNSRIGNENHIVNSIIMDSEVGHRCHIGPYAYLRPGSVLADQVKIGDFVEVKKSYIGTGSKIPHHSYIGDAQVGAGVNIGCGTITCNYDGTNKYQTVIEDGVFVGGNSNLVAPVTLKENAFIAAGSTVTKDIPQNSLAITRAPLKIKENWRK